MTTPRWPFLLAGFVLFISGVAAGQQGTTDKFSKYLAPARVSEMDISLLFANVTSLQDNAITNYLNYSIPRIAFDQKTRKLMIKRLVRAISENSKELADRAQLDYLAVKVNFPEATESDIVWQFFEGPLGRVSLADYKNGRLVFR